MSRVVSVAGLGPRGFTLTGAGANDLAGWSVSGAGDVNGDGFDDIIVGAPYAGGLGVGAAYVIYGHPGNLPDIDLAHLLPDQGFKIASSHFAGLNVAGAGDVNGDGFDDVIVGTFDGAASKATAYVVFGKAHQAGDVVFIGPSDGFGITVSEASYYATQSLHLASAGDVNGDGFDDVIVGAIYANGNKGAAYVIFGKADGFANIDVGSLTAAQGFAILGKRNDGATGAAVSGAGDINGDGFDDIIIGSPNDNGGNSSGSAYVIFGKATGFGTIDLATFAAPTGFVIRGQSAGDLSGDSVSAAGDFNGDGFDDIVVAAPFHGTNGNVSAGSAYVIYGKATGFTDVDLSNLGSAGVEIRGAANGDGFGSRMASAGDINRDGFDDLLVSATGVDFGGTDFGGAAYVIYGRPAGSGPIDVANLSTSSGFMIQTSGAGIGFGFAASGAGDFNGDGFADVLLGAPFNVANGGDRAFLVSTRTLVSTLHNDFNGDGISDVLWENDNRTVREWTGRNSHGNFTTNIANVNFLAGEGSHMIAAGDFNGDGKADTLWQSADGRVTDLLAQPGGGFIDNSAHVNIFTGLEWHAIGAGDFNGDGIDDVLWQHDNGTVRDWLGKADGTFAGNIALVNFVAAAGSHMVGTGDFNGDGCADMLWQTFDGVVIDILGNRFGGFVDNSGLVNIRTGLDWHVIGTGDFNGDGRDDVLLRNDNGTIREWLGQADGTFTGNIAHVNFIPAAGAHVIDIGDYNGDGRADLLWSNAGTVTQSLAETDGSFTDNSANVNIHTGTDWHAQAPFVHDVFA